MPDVSKKYSRGNDDPSEPQYETAKIEVTLHINTEVCQQEGDYCDGEVVIKLSYKATSSTDDPMFFQAEGVAELKDNKPNGESSGLIHGAPPPLPQPIPSPKGSTLTATVRLGSVPCTGGSLTGTASIRDIPATPTSSSFVYETITYNVVITSCGVITTSQLSVVEHTRPGRNAKPLKDITPPAGGGNPPEEPYPDKP